MHRSALANLKARLEPLEVLASNLRESLPEDVTFILDDGSKINGKRAIIACRSMVFKSMLFGDMREGAATDVKLSQISMTCMKAVIECASTGGFMCTLNKEIYYASANLSMDATKK